MYNCDLLFFIPIEYSFSNQYVSSVKYCRFILSQPHIRSAPLRLFFDMTAGDASLRIFIARRAASRGNIYYIPGLVL
jgi:hypothetical protein